MWLVKDVDCIQKTVILYVWLSKSSLTEVIFQWAFIWDPSIFTFLTHSEICIQVSLPHTSLPPIFQLCFFFFLNLWACIQTIGHSIWIDIHLCFWTLPFLRKINNQVHGLSSAYGRVYLHYTPSGMSQKRVIMLQLTTLGGACTCRTICKPSLSFLFLSELVVENSSWRHRCGIWERG